MDEVERKLYDLFFPHAMGRIAQAKDKKDFLFSYYTSASTGMSLLSRNEAWLRNAAFMNDFSEVHHGQECIRYCWNETTSGKRLKSLLTLIDPNAVEQFEQAFDADQFRRTKGSYILCISEHGSSAQDEDKYGRLSMWRAYGGNTNVAFVFRPDIFLGDSNAIEIYTSPVLYADKFQFAQHFEEFVDGLVREHEFIKSIGWQRIFGFLHVAMRSAVLSTKHPGFSEEREWRLIYDPANDEKGRVKTDLVTLEGIPQRIYKVPFENYPEDGFTGATIPELLDRIIVGPTEFPLEIRAAFVDKLAELGVPEPEAKVVISGIPLRRN